jgi:hypothetical protein
MSEKLFSEQFREYCKLIESLSESKEKFEDKILDIIQLLDHHAYSVESYSIIEEHDLLEVNYMGSYCGYVEPNSDFIPMKWLDLDIDEIRKILEAEYEKERKREERRKKREKANKKKKMENKKKAAEKKERKEYERLKAKFEKENNND